MKQGTVFGTWVDTANVSTSRHIPIKPFKHSNAIEFPFECKTLNGTRVVYAQHDRQAWAKCRNMYGSCLRQPRKIC